MKKKIVLMITLFTLLASSYAQCATLVDNEPIFPNYGFFASYPYMAGTSFRFENDTVLTGFGFWGNDATAPSYPGYITSPYWEFSLSTGFWETRLTYEPGGWIGSIGMRDPIMYVHADESDVIKTEWYKPFYYEGNLWDSMSGFHYVYNFESPVLLQGGVTYVMEYQYKYKLSQGDWYQYGGDPDFSTYNYNLLTSPYDYEFRAIQDNRPIPDWVLAYQLFGYTAPVPEPATVLLLVLGLAGLLGVRGRRVK